MGPPLLFSVVRRCSPGLCPGSSADACDCWDPTVYVDVDELTEDELAGFQEHGTAEQRAEIAGWLDEDLDPAELLAGQPDRFPELVPA